MDQRGGANQQQQQQSRKEEGGKLEGLPVDSSPYTQYKDLEDYKEKGYGTHGHQQPVTGRGAGATDAPTPSGAAATTKPSSQSQGKDTSATDVINRLGVP